MALRSCVRGCVTSLIILVLLAGASVSTSAQAIFGTIVGTVVDPSGAPVPGAAIKAISSGTNEVRTTFTGSGGTYSVPNLPAGTYRVEVRLRGHVSAWGP